MTAMIVGSRIRSYRRDAGMSQAQLAKKVGISASYLNLIEWNKRPATNRLLPEIARALSMDAADLEGESERRLQEHLVEIAHHHPADNFDIEWDQVGELIGRFPGWARFVGALSLSEKKAMEHARALSDRMANDPFLNETVHRMLTRIAAIRSAAEILDENADLPEKRKRRFDNIIHDESRILSEIGEALASYLDGIEDTERILTPVDEVEALFEAHGNRFDKIEDATRMLHEQLVDQRPVPRHAIAAELIDEHLSPTIGKLVESETGLSTSAAANRARLKLRSYAIGAILMPMEPFAQEAAAARYDIETLAQSFNVDIGMLCRRLTALSGIGPQFGYVCANAAGTITEMLGLAHLTVPRHAAACPLWTLFRAQQAPETVFRQRVKFPNGDRFVFVARARHIGQFGFGKPRNYVTDMITMTESDARQTVYAPDHSAAVEDVGPNCRLCQRKNCNHRVEDPILGW